MKRAPLRLALKDGEPSSTLIETVGCRGYRLTVPVALLGDEAGVRPALERRRARLAAVPFIELNAESGDFFSDGLTEMIGWTRAACGRKATSDKKPSSSSYRNSNKDS